MPFGIGTGLMVSDCSCIGCEIDVLLADISPIASEVEGEFILIDIFLLPTSRICFEKKSEFVKREFQKFPQACRLL